MQVTIEDKLVGIVQSLQAENDELRRALFDATQKLENHTNELLIAQQVAYSPLFTKN